MYTCYYVVGETIIFYCEYSIIFESCVCLTTEYKYNARYILKCGT